MATIKIINQSNTTYKIKKLGNASYRISYMSENGRNNNVEKVFSSLADAESYIASCANMDKLAAMFK